jgi:hypothetical protein
MTFQTRFQSVLGYWVVLPLAASRNLSITPGWRKQPGVVPDILRLLADHEASIRFLREDARKCTEEYEDEGTFELLVSVMRMHEKMAWMLRSYIENEPVLGKSQERILKDEQ